VHHRTATVQVRCTISFHIGRILPLLLGAGWRIGHCPVHTGQSDAPSRPLELATCRALIARMTIGRRRSWHTRQYGAPSDSLVIYSRTTPSIPESSRFNAGQPGAPDTVWCATEQSGVPGRDGVGCTQSTLSYFFSPSFVTVSSTYTNTLVLKNNVLSLKPYL
jgi:hypothetical protein